MMLRYNREPNYRIAGPAGELSVFIPGSHANADEKTIASFGDEWMRFNRFEEQDIRTCGDEYFDVCEGILKGDEIALDLGCGTGRWSAYLSPNVKFIEAVDPGEAALVAQQYLKNYPNTRVTQAAVDNLPFENNSFDFIFSLGVLHHIPDTGAAIRKLVEKLKPGGHLLLYLYYRFDNRSFLFRALFYLSNLLRLVVSRLPSSLKQVVCDLLALLVYLPLVALARIVKKIFGGEFYTRLPLAYYTDKSFYIMRNDALDRFGTPLEQRFTRHEITAMLKLAGMANIRFSSKQPYWHLIARKP